MDAIAVMVLIADVDLSTHIMDRVGHRLFSLF
jgi:hypothetical protein